MATNTLHDSHQLGLRLGVRSETIRSWARQGRIPCIRITGKVIRFDWEDVLAALREAPRQSDPRDPRVS